MADVYKSRDHKLNRNVAIKVLKAEFRGDKAFVSKFRIEAQAAAGLAHPNIVNVYDVGDEDGIYFIVMELIEGITLKDYIRNKGKLSVREAAGVALQVAAGLEAAHRSGIIHRDVKPQNIILSTDGTAKVADFGIARAVTGDTYNSSVMGSVHYTAPEQARGGYSDAKSDIYSLGITMYEMLTGRVPFDGDSTVEVALKHLHEKIVSPRQYVPDLPRSIEQIILKCTQKKPSHRYQNMSLLIKDLKESLINPNGDFVRIDIGTVDAETHLFTREDLKAINRQDRDIGRTYQEGYRRTGSIYDRPGYSGGGDYLGESYDSPPISYGGTRHRYYGSDVDGYYDEYDPESEDEDDDFPEEDLEEVQPKGRPGRPKGRGKNAGTHSTTERLVTLISVIVAAGVGLIILYLLVHSFGLIGRSAGQGSTEGESQNLVIDLSTELVSVPSILGLTENEAQEKLRNSKLGYKYLGEQASSDYAAGQVLSQDVQEGMKVKPNSQIGYRLSTGSGVMLTIPELSQKSQAEAEKTLTDMGLLVSVDNTRYSEAVPEGSVITTNPGAGSAASEGDRVTIYVSQGAGSQTVQVPKLIGHYESDAVQLLTNYGLYAFVTHESSELVSEGLVISQDLREGSYVPNGSTITITVSTGPREEPAADPVPGENTVWMCNALLEAPKDYDGGTVRITLEQNGIEKTIYEGRTAFPYILKVSGLPGVTGGTAYVYVLDNVGNIMSKTNYSPIDFTEVSR